MNQTPIATVCRNPLVGPEERIVVRLGTRIRDLEPESRGGLIVCRFNGEWLLREHWDELVGVGDRVEWYEYPQGREGIRLLLQIALIAAVLTGQAEFVPYLVAANAAYNLLVPPRAPSLPQQGAAPGSVFGTSLAGNAARLDQPIWKNCGRVKITPPFAAQPYVEFLPSDPDNPDVDTDQYYYAIFAIGVGDHEIEKALIGKTSISHFQDVLIAQYLAPGVQPSQALANVVTSDEVSASLEMPEARYVGGYTASRPNQMVSQIGIDVAASQGLGIGTSPLTVEWRVEAREVDQWGRPIGSWDVIGSESITMATNTPQRWSRTYNLVTSIRPEVRVVRTNPKNTDPNARDGIQWIGLRAYLEDDSTLNPDTAHYEVVMRASEQLSSFSQRDFSMIVRGLVRTWHPDAGWNGPVFTRNPMWWLADLWTNEVWGEGLPEDRVDLQGLYDIAQTLDARQDRFDYSFTTARDSFEAAQLIAHSARCRAFRKGGLYTVARDELVDLPDWGISSRNTEPKSMVLHSSLPRREQPDGVIVEYQSNITWDTATEECPCPGFSATNPDSPFFDTDLPMMASPVYIGLDGVTGRMHALREGIYQAASMAYRTSTVSAKVEMEGVVMGFMDAVKWQPQLPGYGQTGDVAFWDEDTLIMGLSEPPTWGEGELYLSLQREDGTLTEPVAVTPGPTAYDITLPDVPDFAVSWKSGVRERTKFFLGELTGADELVKITAISDGGMADGAQMFDIEALIDDDRVHEADNALLPSPGEIQDPIDDGSEGDEESGLVLVRLADSGLYSGNEIAFGLGSEGGGTGSSLTFNTDGTVTVITSPFGIWNTWTISSGQQFYTEGTTNLANQWMQFPVEESEAANFEVYATDVYGRGWFHGSALDTWLPMTAARNWFVSTGSVPPPDDRADALLRIQVRRIGETAIQGSANYIFNVAIADLTP